MDLSVDFGQPGPPSDDDEPAPSFAEIPQDVEDPPVTSARAKRRLEVQDDDDDEDYGAGGGGGDDNDSDAEERGPAIAKGKKRRRAHVNGHDDDVHGSSDLAAAVQ
ncbi:hypothetical protein HK405_001432, partial [Cladochytrium tenue]